MKKLKIFITFLLGFLLFGCSNKNSDELVMVTEAGFAPYEYYENNKIVGVDIEIANQIAQALNKKLVVKDIAFDSIINEINAGKADFGAAGISITEERKKQIDFTIEYATSNQVVIVKKDSLIKTFDDIKDKRISVQLGTTADSYASENYKSATIIRQKKYLTTAEDVKNNKADGIIMDALPAKELVKQNTNLKILDDYLFSDKYRMVVKKGNTKLFKQINDVLQKLIDEGKIDEYIIKYSK